MKNTTNIIVAHKYIERIKELSFDKDLNRYIIKMNDGWTWNGKHLIKCSSKRNVLVAIRNMQHD